MQISEGKEILSLQRDTTMAVKGSYWSHCKVLNKYTEKNSHHNELHSYHYYEWTHFELLSRYTSVYNEILLICDERIIYIYKYIGHDLCLHLRIKKIPLQISTGYASEAPRFNLLNQNYKHSTPLLKIITQMINLS